MVQGPSQHFYYHDLDVLLHLGAGNGKGELAGLLCYLDVLDHGIFLNKLKLYGLDEEAIKWILSDFFHVS